MCVYVCICNIIVLQRKNIHTRQNMFNTYLAHKRSNTYSQEQKQFSFACRRFIVVNSSCASEQLNTSLSSHDFFSFLFYLVKFGKSKRCHQNLFFKIRKLNFQWQLIWMTLKLRIYIRQSNWKSTSYLELLRNQCARFFVSVAPVIWYHQVSIAKSNQWHPHNYYMLNSHMVRQNRGVGCYK